MPQSGGPPVRLVAGDDLTLDPEGRILVVHNSSGMVRVAISSGTAEPIVLPRGIRLAATNLSAAAIDRKGRILLNVVMPDDFDYKAAIVDGQSVTVIPADRPGDNLSPGWTPEGDVIAVHDVLRSELWRFTRAAK
jgi:hypothetical protein